MIDLKKLEEVARAATPGPWEQRNKRVPYVWATGRVKSRDEYLMHTMPIGEAAADYTPETRACWLADAAHIAAANPAAVLELIATIHEREAALAGVQSRMGGLMIENAAAPSQPAETADTLLPDADVRVGSTGMLGEDCWTRGSVLAHTARAVAAVRADLTAQWDAHQEAVRDMQRAAQPAVSGEAVAGREPVAAAISYWRGPMSAQGIPRESGYANIGAWSEYEPVTLAHGRSVQERGDADKRVKFLFDTAPVPAAAPAVSGDAVAGREPYRIMGKAHSLCPLDLSHNDKMRWMADYFLKNYTAPVPAAAPVQGDSLTTTNPPEFYKYNSEGLEGLGSRADLWAYGQLVGWRQAASVQPNSGRDAALVDVEDKGYATGLRVGLLEGASILREVYVNHVLHTGVQGFDARCKDAEQVLIAKADAAHPANGAQAGDAISQIIDHIADNWPMKKYALDEIEDRLRAFAAAKKCGAA